MTIRFPNGYTKKEIESCIHRGSQVGKKGSGGCACSSKPIYSCKIHNLCTFTAVTRSQKEKVCVTCSDCSPAQTEQNSEHTSQQDNLENNQET